MTATDRRPQTLIAAAVLIQIVALYAVQTSYQHDESGGPHDQSSSASRLIAGAFGFLTLIQCDVRPGRYDEPNRFDTMPSQPSLQACLKTMAPT
jgi:hypothetical protein